MDEMVVDLWGESIADLRGTRKNSHVFMEMSEKLKSAGFSGTWPDARTKIDTLTRKYKTEKIKIGPSGGEPSSWAFYDKVHCILEGLRVHDVGSPRLTNTMQISLNT
ncbi:trihelix transcription factor ASIL2-like [Drosophila innubila]|uniref:trihelix transcription factor ASIL2-like n=1 Tax=Drosophila innubila TaxID=198719 RepID=UPI00148BDA0A|nr:trihelix transcription factor ASIL2-like [Drosophila innubila]